MKKTIIILIAAAFIIASEGELYETQSYIENFVFNCEKPGLQCDGCEKSYICIDIGGTFIPQLVEDCELNNMTCLAATGKCTSDENLDCNPDSTEYKFKCHQKGMFPHPFFCNKYFICNESQTPDGDPQLADPTSCNSGFVYDPMTTLCNKRGECSSPPVKPCEVLGEMGGIEGHPSMYFVCLFRPGENSENILAPDLYVCSDDQIFKDGRCIAPEKGLDGDGKCSKPGNFFDPKNCQKYNECAKQGVEPVTKSCDTGKKFNPAKGTCEAMTC